MMWALIGAAVFGVLYTLIKEEPIRRFSLVLFAVCAVIFLVLLIVWAAGGISPGMWGPGVVD